MTCLSPTARAPTRRSFLQSAAAGALIGRGAISGFPKIWAQNIKDITLRHAGPAVTAVPRIAEQATQDLGFTVKMQTTQNMDLLNRLLSQSNALNYADISMAWLKYMPCQDVLQTIPVEKFKFWDETLPMFTKGHYADIQRLPDGHPYSAADAKPRHLEAGRVTVQTSLF